MGCRHCANIRFDACYSSVLVYGTASHDDVSRILSHELERDIHPSFSAFCSTCREVSGIACSTSADAVRALVVFRRLRDFAGLDIYPPSSG
jgi:hypothetical protein